MSFPYESEVKLYLMINILSVRVARCDMHANHCQLLCMVHNQNNELIHYAENVRYASRGGQCQSFLQDAAPGQSVKPLRGYL